MIMDDPDEVAAATPEIPAPGAAPSSPSTRGWTMLEELNESPEADPAEAQVAAPEDGGAAPTSRGWTMFMEAEIEGEQAEEAPAPEPEPGFYEGQLTTDAGTVVAFAPDAPKPAPKDAPIAAAPTAPAEAMSSFASKLRGEEEPVSSFASKLRGEEEPAAAPSSVLETSSDTLEELAQQATSTPAPTEPTPVVPSFGPTTGGGFDLKPTAPTMAEPVDYDDDEPKKSSTGTIVAVLVMVAMVGVIIYFLAT